MNIRIKMFGIIALAAIIVFSLVACGDGDNNSKNEVTKFEGKWVNMTALDPQNGFSDYSWTFTGNKCVFISDDGKGTEISRPGTFTFTDTTITFKPEKAGTWTGYMQGYTLSDDVLDLENNGNPFGEFTKQ